MARYDNKYNQQRQHKKMCNQNEIFKRNLKLNTETNNRTIYKFCFKSIQILILFQILFIKNHECSYGERIGFNDGAKNSAIKAAINTRHTVGYHDIDLPTNEQYEPNLIEVKSSVPSFTLKFNSASSKLKVFHQHESSKHDLQPKESYSEDEPHILRHKVIKPIVQSIREVISPFRQIVQEIKPVSEQIDTILARGNNNGNSAAAALLSAMVPPPRPPMTSIAPLIASKPVINQAMAIDHSQNNDNNNNLNNDNQEYGLFAQKALISDLSKLANKPDLIFVDENELFDNSLYNGANEFDLKYPSLNSDNNSPHDLYQD